MPSGKAKPYENDIELCDYGCNTIAKFIFNNKKKCCCEYISGCSARALKGEKNPMYGRRGEDSVWWGKKHTPETLELMSKNCATKRPEVKEKLSKILKGKTKTEEHKKKLSIGVTKYFQEHPEAIETMIENIKKTFKEKNISKHISDRINKRYKDNPEQLENWKKVNVGRVHTDDAREKARNRQLGKKHTKEEIQKLKDSWTEERRNKQRQLMLNGKAAYLNQFISNPSKPQIALFEMIQSIYPSAQLNYPSCNKSIDIAIPELNIAIEYDEPYWHQDEEKDKQRQDLLESAGWKFIRYSSLPTLENVKEALL